MKVRLKITVGVRWLARAEGGGALAELAIMVPFLVVMVAAVTEIGRFFQTYTTLAKGIRSSTRYLSNREAPYTNDDMTKAANLVVCGKLVCAGDDELVTGMTTARVCVEDRPATQTVRVSIPRVAKNCTNGDIVPHPHQPIFDIGALINSDTFTLAVPISPSTTMYYTNKLD